VTTQYCITVKDAKARYGVSRSTLMRLAATTGALRKIGRAVRFDVALMDQAVDACAKGGVEDGRTDEKTPA